MNQPDGNSARGPQEHAEELDWISYLDEVPDREDYEDDPPEADGVLLCAACGKPAIIKGKEEYGGGWVCFKKQEGCGAKFADDDLRITSQVIGRIENPDIFDQMNTIDKIAQKRALGSAIKGAANVSSMFTVDLEDLAPYAVSTPRGDVVDGQFEEVARPNAAAANAASADPLAWVDEAAPGAKVTVLPTLDMKALYNRAMKAKIGVKNWNHFQNLYELLADAELVTLRSTEDEVFEAMKAHEAQKEAVS